DRDIFVYDAFGGEALSLEADEATIEEMRNKNVPNYLAAQGRKLIRGYNEIAVELEMSYTRATGMECRSLVSFDHSSATPLEMKSFVQQEMIRRGVLWGGMHVVSFSHTDDDIAHILAAYHE